MTQELKACPFCDNEAQSFISHHEHGDFTALAQCTKCGAEIGRWKAWAQEDEADAALEDVETAWNTRAFDALFDELVALAAQYRSDLMFPPSGDSLERRVKRINDVLAKLEASK